ncbi:MULTISPECIES: glycerate kinase [unclassified Halanaerobium]|uniref:glycerate kinase family protein n=1 Tax=unclassified Halanaerobium TaxID=2641197 RepID=UPI000DF1EABC|nr:MULTISPECIES: glycerate kinase [unclassified Halanaerobium]RCW46352.1 glycerate kinase [Halanaerobium sp. MA284_MarDTE_T2]RCW82513.1 glycerate kinase [Halanaerobium sp. DL-01]
MKILIAPDSFKGSLTALEAASAVEKGIKNFDMNIETQKIPLADGGEGTIQALIDFTGGRKISKKVHDPLGRIIEAEYALLDDGTAVIEMAEASGLTLLSPEERNPLVTTTYGTGELIADALNEGAKKLIIAIGGSATNDAGVGLAQALGAHFFDKNAEEISFGGENLSKIKEIDLSKLKETLKGVEVITACDVDNPFYGENGAAYVYAPQKGADAEMVKILDKNLKHFAGLIKREFNIDLQKIPGTGAAGGLGGGLITFLNSELKSGIEIVLDKVGFDNYLKNVDLLITGEGMIDSQTVSGKAAAGAASRAKKHNIDVIAVAGSLAEGYKKVNKSGIDAVFSILKSPITLEEAMQSGDILLEELTEQIIRLYLLGK